MRHQQDIRMSTTLIPPTTLTQEPARQTAVALARSTTPQWPQLPGDSWQARLNEDKCSANRHQASVSPGRRPRQPGHLRSAQKYYLPSGNFTSAKRFAQHLLIQERMIA